MGVYVGFLHFFLIYTLNKKLTYTPCYVLVKKYHIIMKYLKLFENFHRKLQLNEINQHRLSYFPLGKFTLRLMEVFYNKNKYRVKYHDGGVNYDTFDLNAINFNFENDQLHVSFSEKIKDEVEPLINNFFKSELESLKQFQQKRNLNFIGEFDNVIEYPAGSNYGKKIVTLKFDY